MNRSMIPNNNDNSNIKKVTYKVVICTTDEKKRQVSNRGEGEQITLSLTKDNEYKDNEFNSSLGSIMSGRRAYSFDKYMDYIYQLVVFNKLWQIIRREKKISIEHFKTKTILAQGSSSKMEVQVDYDEFNDYDDSYITLYSDNTHSDNGKYHFKVCYSIVKEIEKIREDEHGIYNNSFIEVIIYHPHFYNGDSRKFEHNTYLCLKMFGDNWWLIEYKDEERTVEHETSEVIYQGTNFEEDVIVVTTEEIGEWLLREKMALEDRFKEKVEQLAKFKFDNEKYLELTFIKIALIYKVAESKNVLKKIDKVDNIKKEYERTKEKRRLDAKINVVKVKYKGKSQEQINIEKKFAEELEIAEQRLQIEADKKEIEKKLRDMNGGNWITHEYEYSSKNDIYKPQTTFKLIHDREDGDFYKEYRGVFYQGEFYEQKLDEHGYDYEKYSFVYMTLRMPQNIAELAYSIGEFMVQAKNLQKSKVELMSELEKLNHKQKFLLDEISKSESKIAELENKIKETHKKMQTDIAELNKSFGFDTAKILGSRFGNPDYEAKSGVIYGESIALESKYNHEKYDYENKVSKHKECLEQTEVEQAKLLKTIEIIDAGNAQTQIEQNNQQIAKLESQLENKLADLEQKLENVV